MTDVVVIGAGVSGLSFARHVAAQGVSVVVLDKARGVGGRCATRRIDGQPVDLGVTYLHGSHPAFVDAVRSVASVQRIAWPSRIEGEGPPCSPRALAEGEQRFAMVDGLTAFAKHLAAGLDVRLSTRVIGLQTTAAGVALALANGGELTARTIVLALPMEQARELLAPLRTSHPDIAGAHALMGLARTSSCLTVAALYPRSVPSPDFDVFLPPLSSSVSLIAHDSAKRRDPRWTALVIQARTRWSRERLEAPPELWSLALLEEASRFVGSWVSRPAMKYEHRWRFARLDGAPAFRGPVLLSLGAARLGLTGEGFIEGGGVQGAFLSGRALAERFLETT